ncbi:hypothetical protein [Halobacterium sp. R2-5]|uniref:hypothetical protein n=1 Tax=Halobacterium sp. R2-5 TaxID=2715751 RepID=UPI001FBBF1F5|nr:hypothetical protein [Halobacterium sp. R2-5]
MTDESRASSPEWGALADGGDSDSDDSAGDTSSDTMSGRLRGGRLRAWLLLSADRWRVTALFSVTVFAAIVLTSFLDVTPMRRLVTSQSTLWWVFSPLIGAVVTGVTLVVTFTQLVLSQELGPLGDQRERMQGAIDFRDDVESRLDVSPAPPDPSSFLEALVAGAKTRAEDLREAADEFDDETTRERVHAYVDSLTDQAERIGDGLEDATFGEFDVVYSALDFNYSWKIYEAERLREKHGDELDADARAAIDDLVDVLEFFGPAREHFKTLYFQWELVNLSRLILYAALPALTVAFLVQFYVSPTSFPGTYLGVDGLVWVLSAGVTITLVPFFLLTAHVLRIATVARRTLAIGPFILRDTDRTEDIDWE